MRDRVGMKWYDLGIELLPSDVAKLNTIEADYPTNNNKCCNKMFQLWLDRQPEASWDQLTLALRQHNVGLDALAADIEKLLENNFQG